MFPAIFHNGVYAYYLREVSDIPTWNYEFVIAILSKTISERCNFSMFVIIVMRMSACFIPLAAFGPLP